MSYFHTIKCDIEKFKQVVADFAKAADSGTLDETQLESGIGAVHLLYLGLPVGDLSTAKGYLEYANARYWRADTVKRHLARPSENPSDE